MFQRRNKPDIKPEKQVDSKKHVNPKKDESNIENTSLFKSLSGKTKKENLFSNYSENDTIDKINVYVKQTLMLNRYITKYILLMKTIDFCKNVLNQDIGEEKIVSIVDNMYEKYMVKNT